MVREIEVLAGEIRHTVIISDEPEALLAAKAAGRAVIGVEPCGAAEGEVGTEPGEKSAPAPGRIRPDIARYIVPGWEFVSEELAELVLLRHLGLPWTIGVTDRLVIRELTRADAERVPQQEALSADEELFRDPEKLAVYIKGQYGFYEYGTWALVRKDDGALVGLAGVSQPRLPEELAGVSQPRLPEELAGVSQPRLPEELAGVLEAATMGAIPAEAAPTEHTSVDTIAQPPVCPYDFLELGYRIFTPYRRQGYALEACREILEYTHEVLGGRVCAVIQAENKASCRLAERLGMNRLSEGSALMETDSGSSQPLLLYGEIRSPQPGRED